MMRLLILLVLVLAGCGKVHDMTPQPSEFIRRNGKFIHAQLERQNELLERIAVALEKGER